MHSIRRLVCVLVVPALGVAAVLPLGAHAQPPDTLWRPESGVAMLVWDSVIPMAGPGEPIDTVALPFGNIASLRVAGGGELVRVLRDGIGLRSVGSSTTVYGLWFEAVAVGEVARFDACASEAAGDACWSVALRRPAGPEVVVVAPRDVVPNPTYRHSGRAVPGGGMSLAHGRGPPADTVDLHSADRLSVRVTPPPDSVVASLHARSPAMPESTIDPVTRSGPDFTWAPVVPPGEVREWLICAWWGSRTHECRVVGLRGVGEPWPDSDEPG